MCRLFALLGQPPRPASSWLVGSERSLLSLANVRDAQRQGEGWGVAWYDEHRRVTVEKGVGCASDPSEHPAYLRAAERAAGPLIIAHLRKASNPMHLEPEHLLGPANSQPFHHGSTIFAHNGAIPLPRETRALTGRYRHAVQGVNDSEVFFYLLLRHLDTEPHPPRAYARAIADLETVWEAHGRPTPRPYSGLNILLSRGPHELWAFCHSLGEHGTGLRDEGCPYYEMAFTHGPGFVLVASERLDPEPTGWNPLANGHYLVAQDDRGVVRWRMGSIPTPRPALVAASG